MTAIAVREEYNSLARSVQALLDGDSQICPKCGTLYPCNDANFYKDINFHSNRFPICKRCMKQIVEKRSSTEEPSQESQETVLLALRMMDLPYIDYLYKDCVRRAKEEEEYARESPFSLYIMIIKTVPKWSGYTYMDSEFGSEPPIEPGIDEPLPKARDEIKKLFGAGLEEEDYLFLQEQYDDWISRTQVDSKSQETYIIRICFKLLDIWRAEKAHEDTTSLDKSLNELMAAAKLQPKQNVDSAASDSLTFGQLIEKWENEDPIPEPSEEFKDVDGIGKYIRVFFAGHLAKALGLKNAYTDEYTKYMREYTVEKPSAVEDGTSADIYKKMFGNEGGD